MDKKRISIITLIVGLVTLVAGVVFLIIRLTAASGVADGEYLVSIGKWGLEGGNCVQAKCGENAKCVGPDGEATVICDGDGVIWNFTEIGKGTLTTNAHENDYDFIWSIEDGKLKIETKWLYDLENEYDYKLDQDKGELVLSADGEEHKFVVQE